MHFVYHQEHEAAKASLRRASQYLRSNHGRTETEGPRRILTEASRIVGTEAEGVDLSKTNITARVKL